MVFFSVDEDNSPQWRKLAWSQDCSMLACSYRFVNSYLHVTEYFKTLLGKACINVCVSVTLELYRAYSSA